MGWKQNPKVKMVKTTSTLVKSTLLWPFVDFYPHTFLSLFKHECCFNRENHPQIMKIYENLGYGRPMFNEPPQ